MATVPRVCSLSPQQAQGHLDVNISISLHAHPTGGSCKGPRWLREEEHLDRLLLPAVLA